MSHVVLLQGTIRIVCALITVTNISPILVQKQAVFSSAKQTPIKTPIIHIFILHPPYIQRFIINDFNI